MKPGEIITKQNSDINLNDKSQSIILKVSNSGDRPIQVGSHYHFAETNEYLKFDNKIVIRCLADDNYDLKKTLNFIMKNIIHDKLPKSWDL